VSAFSSLTQRSLRDLGRVAIYPPRSCSTRTAPPCSRTRTGRSRSRPGSSRWRPSCCAGRAVVAWQPRLVAAEAEERLSELPAAARKRGYLRAEDVAELVAGMHAFDALPQGQATVFEGQRPAIAARGIAEAENELRNQVRAGQRVVVAFPHRGDAERTAPAAEARRRPAARAGRGAARTPGVYLVVSRLRRGLVSSQLSLTVLPSALLFRRRAAGDRAARPRRAVVHRPAPGDYVVHEDHGVGRFVGFDTKTVAGVTRDYLCLDVQGRGPAVRAARADREGVALHRLGRARRRCCRSSAARRGTR
jgi:hypothetical protein